MQTMLLPMIAAALILVVGGTIGIILLTRYVLKPGWLRTVLRLAGVVVLVALVGGLTLSLSGVQSAQAQQTAVPTTPQETMVVSLGTLTQTLGATGSLEPANQQVLTFSTNAPVTQVLVSLGDTVQAGDVLAVVDDTDLQANLRDAQITQAQAQASLNALVAPPSEIDIQIAEASVQSAQASLYSASNTAPSANDIEIERLQLELAKNSLYQSQLNRDMSANNSGRAQLNQAASDTLTAASLEQSAGNITQAQMEYENVLSEGPNAGSLASANAQFISAQAQLDQLLNGPTESELRQAQISVETALLTVQSAEDALDDVQLVAPFDGVIADMNLTAGTLPGSDAITLVDVKNYTIDVSVDEKDVTQISVGQKVEIAVSAIPDAQVTGTITHIDVAPTISGQLVTYVTEVTLDPTDVELRPGMSVVATIVLDELNDVIVIPNRFLKADETTGQTLVTVQTAAGEYTDVVVTVGEATSSESQIVNGLQIGQTIALMPTVTTTTQSGFTLFGGGALPGAGGGPPAGFQGGGGQGRPPGG